MKYDRREVQLDLFVRGIWKLIFFIDERQCKMEGREGMTRKETKDKSKARRKKRGKRLQKGRESTNIKRKERKKKGVDGAGKKRKAQKSKGGKKEMRKERTKGKQRNEKKENVFLYKYLLFNNCKLQLCVQFILFSSSFMIITFS